MFYRPQHNKQYCGDFEEKCCCCGTFCKYSKISYDKGGIGVLLAWRYLPSNSRALSQW